MALLSLSRMDGSWALFHVKCNWLQRGPAPGIKVVIATTSLPYGLTLGFAYLMPDYWLEVSLHPEGPATGHLDQGFLWFSSVLEQILSWCQYSTLHCMLHVQPSQWLTSNFRPNLALSILDQNFFMMQLFQYHKTLTPIMCITSTRRTSGHCLGTFTTADIFPCFLHRKCVFHYLTNFFLFSLSSSLHFLMRLIVRSLLFITMQYYYNNVHKEFKKQRRFPDNHSILRHIIDLLIYFTLKLTKQKT
jgi:hypothetical protein